VQGSTRSASIRCRLHRRRLVVQPGGGAAVPCAAGASNVSTAFFLTHPRANSLAAPGAYVVDFASFTFCVGQRDIGNTASFNLSGPDSWRFTRSTFTRGIGSRSACSGPKLHQSRPQHGTLRRAAAPRCSRRPPWRRPRTDRPPARHSPSFTNRRAILLVVETPGDSIRSPTLAVVRHTLLGVAPTKVNVTVTADKNSISVTWSPNQDNDFQAYQSCYSVDPTVIGFCEEITKRDVDQLEVPGRPQHPARADLLGAGDRLRHRTPATYSDVRAVQTRPPNSLTTPSCWRSCHIRGHLVRWSSSGGEPTARAERPWRLRSPRRKASSRGASPGLPSASRRRAGSGGRASQPPAKSSQEAVDFIARMTADMTTTANMTGRQRVRRAASGPPHVRVRQPCSVS